MKVRFEIKTELQQRGSVEPLEVEGTLLVAENPLPCSWMEAHPQYGSDRATLTPAVHNGDHAFLLQKVWCPVPGYCASGTQEELISITKAVQLLTKHGLLSHLWPSK